MLSDTDKRIQRLQLERANQATPAEKIAQVRRMTDRVVRLSRRAIARANPTFSEEEIGLRWVEIHYGRRLASELREYLKQRPPCNPSTP